MAFAVRHPERVSRLVLYGAYTRGRLARATTEREERQADLDLELTRAGWDGENRVPTVFASQFLARTAPGREWDALNELQRRTPRRRTGPGSWRRSSPRRRRPGPAGRCPTLIVHSRDDPRVPACSARELAELIPDSRLVVLPGRNHLLTGAEPAWPLFLYELDRFLDG